MNIVYSALKHFSKNAPHIQAYLNVYWKNPGIWSMKPKNREKRHCIRYKVENRPMWDWYNSNLPELRSAYLCLRTLSTCFSLPLSSSHVSLVACCNKTIYPCLSSHGSSAPRGRGCIDDRCPPACFLTTSTQDFGGSPPATAHFSQDQRRALHVHSSFLLKSLKKWQIELLNLKVPMSIIESRHSCLKKVTIVNLNKCLKHEVKPQSLLQ